MNSKIHIYLTHIHHIQSELNIYTDESLEKFKDAIRKKESLVARFLLDKLSYEIYHITLKELVLKKNNLGKPYFQNNNQLHCSISHSNGWVIVGISDVNFGIDIEKIDIDKAHELETAFSSSEWSQIKNDPILVLTSFSFKESVSKMLGTGFTKDPTSISLLNSIHKYKTELKINEKEKYILTLVSESKCSVEKKMVIGKHKIVI